MFTRIVVPLDGSARAEHALPVAVRLARASGGSLMLVQVAALPVIYETYTAASYTAEVVEAEIEEAEDYLRTLAQSELLAGVKTETKALFGAAAQTILSVALSYNADLIVMTSQGKTGLKRWVLGSVAQKIARYSSVPVLVLHEGGSIPAGPHPDGSPMRALVTLDGSVLAKSAVEPTAQLLSALSEAMPAVLHLLRVVKTPGIDEAKVTPEQLVELKKQTLHKAKSYMNNVVSHLREGPLANLNIRITWSVALDADVADAILRVAENGEDAEGAGVFGRCDLIAMATHGRTGLQHWVLGSVTERVLSSTRLPILIVRPAQENFKSASNNRLHEVGKMEGTVML